MADDVPAAVDSRFASAASRATLGLGVEELEALAAGVDARVSDGMGERLALGVDVADKDDTAIGDWVALVLITEVDSADTVTLAVVVRVGIGS